MTATSGDKFDTTRLAELRDYLALWQYFQKRGADVKESMVKILTWIVGFMSAVLGFMVEKTIAVGGAAGFRVEQPASTLILALIGLALSGFGVIVLRDYTTHIDGHFDSADNVLRKSSVLRELLEIEPSPRPAEYKGPRLSRRLRVIVLMFAAAFAAAAVAAGATLVGAALASGAGS